MKLILKFFTYLLLLLTCNVFAASTSDLSNVLNSIRTMKANFIQTVYDNRGKAIQQSKGQMALARPGKFRWDVKKPIPQLIIANNTKLWIYDPDLQQVTIKSLQHVTGETPALLLSHENNVLENDYKVSETNENKMAGWRW